MSAQSVSRTRTILYTRNLTAHMHRPNYVICEQPRAHVQKQPLSTSIKILAKNRGGRRGGGNLPRSPPTTGSATCKVLFVGGAAHGSNVARGKGARLGALNLGSTRTSGRLSTILACISNKAKARFSRNRFFVALTEQLELATLQWTA